jgi:hypothetical protein
MRIRTNLTTKGLWTKSAMLLLMLGCSGKPESQSNPDVQQALKVNEQALNQAEEVRQQVQHERRLRDIDRLRHEAEVAETVNQMRVLWVFAVALTCTLAAALMWLAVEIRRRRVLTAVLGEIMAPKPETSPVRDTANTGGVESATERMRIAADHADAA